MRPKKVAESTSPTDPELLNAFLPRQFPDFKEQLNGHIEREHWDDVLLRIMDENREAVLKEHVHFRTFMTSKVVQLVFTICVRLELPHEVRYLAVAIFDDFMTVQSTQLHADIFGDEDPEGMKLQRWENASVRFYAQTLLRLVSSISIAIKFSYYRLGLPLSYLQRILLALNNMYSEESIYKSDIRVFAAVMHKIKPNRNPVGIMETFLSIIIHRFPSMRVQYDPEILWEYGILFMDFVFFKCKGILPSLMVRNSSRSKHKELFIDKVTERTWHLESDYVVLGLGCLAVAAWAIYGESGMLEIQKNLSTITRVAEPEISLFAITMRALILEDEADFSILEPPNDLLGMKHMNVPNSVNTFSD
ncbi:Cyclin N-terminal domain-containing protein [Aphelenchoides besseyi]|nr:Cyclin N-terminal domain-containing protein [Aphelenchoides besseyi]